jgi:hypothetical protein
MYTPRHKSNYYEKMRKYTHRLPPHAPENYTELIDEIQRKNYIHPSTPTEKEGIVKITFICGCHGQIIGSFKDLGGDISMGGKYEKTVESNSGFIPSQLNKVTYFVENPLLEFEYTELDTSQLNIFLTTSGTCVGGVVYRPSNSAIIKQRFINDIMEELTETCPMNTLFESKGDYGKTTRISHKNYKTNQLSELQSNAVRKIQRMYRTKKNIPHPIKEPETCIMNYENEKVEKIIDKNYAIRLNDVYGFEDKPGELELVPTISDAHKIIMIITRSTADGCISEKYVLLSNVQEVTHTIKRIQENISHTIASAFHSMITTVISSEKTKKGRPMIEKTPRITLQNLLTLGGLIIQEVNGSQDLAVVPIKVYDLTCNEFEITSPRITSVRLNERELSIIRIINDYIRKNDIACGKRKRKKRIKRK